MRVKLLKRLRKKAKSRTGIRYEDGYYRVYKSKNIYCTTYSGGVKKFEVAIEDLAKFRRNLILNWVNDMKEERINRGLRNL
jgi:hypothetical protein